MKNPDRRNKYFFGLGTIGRDMFYAFEANALLYFLSNILSLPIHVFAAVSLVLSVLRIADALNDPITGLVIDNIHTKWGKFKPAILVGGVVSVIFYLILFGNVGTGTAYVIFFAVAYVLWDISYGINDIAYWTLLPALTQDQKQRENYGAFARICANIGMYIIMVGWQPITAALGNTPKAWMTVAVSVSVIYLAGLCFPLFGVKENREIKEDDEKFTIRDMWNALTKNDQLMWTTLSMALFMVGYCTTTGFATYYMQYLYGDINMYAVLAAVCGAGLLLWRLGCFLPRWIVWQEADCFCTAEEGPEQLSLHRKTLRAVSDGSEIWRSAAGQKVQSLLWCDIDHDGAPELLLLVWRWGRFGKSRPFWKTGPDWGWSQHIDIYDWTGKNFRPAWMASDIGLDAAAWQFDEQQRLVITERSGRESAWDWISWGLVRIA